MKVAPRAGAWIETGAKQGRCAGLGVAPRAGAWIETGVISGIGPPNGGRAPRGRVD